MPIRVPLFLRAENALRALRLSPALFAAAAGALMLSASAASADPGRATGAVNMRECASTRCARILTIPAGAPVEVVGAEGAWYEVEYLGRSGFVYSRYIALSGYVAPPVYAPPLIYEEPYYYDPYFYEFRLPLHRRDHRRHRDHRPRGHDHDHAGSPHHNNPLPFIKPKPKNPSFRQQQPRFHRDGGNFRLPRHCPPGSPFCH